MNLSRRQFVIGATAAGLVPTNVSAAVGDELTPEAFGAKGDGRTNDTLPFAALSAHVNARGSGTITLRPVTYVVGAQQHTPSGSFSPLDILHFEGCAGSIVVNGNGATLRAAAGLRFGTFDLQTGAPTRSALAGRDFPKHVVNAYPGMIFVHNCSGSVEISDLELDGNLQSLYLGGKYNEALGWEAQAHGIWFRGHSGAATLSRLHLHHHGMDGIVFTDPVIRQGFTKVSDVTSEFNGRCAGSITSGRNYSFERCKFLNSGKAGMRNAPASGFDVEPDFAGIRNVSFFDCEFSDNSGIALVAGRGDTDAIRVNGCRFVGTDRWAAWPDTPHAKFNECTFVGSIIHPHGDPDPSRAAQFLDCTFTDDRALSPNGEVFIDRGSIAIIPEVCNAMFSRCKFRLTSDACLPRSTKVIYADCEMFQRTPALSRPIGTYIGATTITGNADITGSVIRGTVVLNGRQIPRTG